MTKPEDFLFRWHGYRYRKAWHWVKDWKTLHPNINRGSLWGGGRCKIFFSSFFFWKSFNSSTNMYLKYRKYNIFKNWMMFLYLKSILVQLPKTNFTPHSFLETSVEADFQWTRALHTLSYSILTATWGRSCYNFYRWHVNCLKRCRKKVLPTLIIGFLLLTPIPVLSGTQNLIYVIPFPPCLACSSFKTCFGVTLLGRISHCPYVLLQYCTHTFNSRL